MPEAAQSATILAPERLSPPGDRDRVDLYLAAFLADALRVRGANPHVAPLLSRAAGFVLQGGKRLRPRLCLASYRILAGDARPPRPVWLAAASLEVFHAFMLVHDDLIDNSLTRRDRPTLHEAIRLEFDTPDGPCQRKRAADLALVGGDLLCALGMRMIGRAGLDDAALGRVHRLVSEMLFETGLGEALDILYGECPLEALSEEQLVEAYLRKTSRYSVSGPLVLGATVAGAPAAAIRALDRFGDLLGFAFQVQNDLNSLAEDVYTGDHADLDGGKRTFVLWLAYRNASEAGRRAIVDALGMPPGLERRRRLLGLIQASGAIEQSVARLDAARREAIDVLRDSPLDAAQRRAFQALMVMFRLQAPSPPGPGPAVVPFAVGTPAANLS